VALLRSVGVMNATDEELSVSLCALLGAASLGH
jgi:hypothetical protein